MHRRDRKTGEGDYQAVCQAAHRQARGVVTYCPGLTASAGRGGADCGEKGGKIMKAWTIIGRHKWVEGCLITESHSNWRIGKTSYRRFTATIRGFRNFKILEGFCGLFTTDEIITKVKKIRDRIDKGDDTVFREENKYETR
jgi:hypothetical protein